MAVPKPTIIIAPDWEPMMIFPIVLAHGVIKALDDRYGLNPDDPEVHLEGTTIKYPDYADDADDLILLLSGNDDLKRLMSIMMEILPDRFTENDVTVLDMAKADARAAAHPWYLKIYLALGWFWLVERPAFFRKIKAKFTKHK